MLTDEEIEKAASKHSDKEHSPFNSDARYHFKAGARLARARHKARLAEDAKVRAALWVALNSLTLNGAGIWKAFEPEIREVVGRANYSAVSESFDKAALALAAAKERG